MGRGAYSLLITHHVASRPQIAPLAPRQPLWKADLETWTLKERKDARVPVAK